MYKGPYDHTLFYIGLSTDVKPSTDVSIGSKFFESNTKLWYIYDGSWNALPAGDAAMTTVTDPLTNAAVSTVIVSAYGGVVITLTAGGNAQTLQSPTITTAGKIFTVVNNDTSGANTIAVNGITIPAGKAQSFIWDGTAWGPIDLGITSLPVPINQGGTGQVTSAAAMNALGVPSATAESDFIAAGASPFAWAKKTIAEVKALLFPAPGVIGKTTPAELWGSPNVSKGPAIINAPAGTVTATASTTVVFSDAATAILAGYSAANPIVGTTVISNGLTRYIVSWTNSTTCVVDAAVTWAGTAITSMQLPIAVFVNSAGVTIGFIAADGNFSSTGNTQFAVASHTNAGITINKILSGNNVFSIQDQGNSLEVGYSGYGGSMQFNGSGISLNNSATGPVKLVGGGGNILTGGLTAAGTSAAKVLAMGSGTMATAAFPADSAQLGVVDYVAGDARWNFMSEASLEKVIIGNGQIAFNANLISDHTVTGRVLIATAGENLVFGDNCYLKSDGKWWKTDADAEATMPGTMMATGTISANATGIFLIEGWARDDSAWAGMTIGSPIYTSQTAGAITQTAPTPTSSATVCIQTVGKAPSTNTATVGIIRYSPEQNFVVAGVDVIDYAAADGAITPAGLTAVPIQFLGDHSSTQTFTLGALTSADVGKKFEVVKKGTGAGVLRLQLPAGTYCHSSGASSSAAGTVTLPVSAYGSFGVRVTSATTIQIYTADCVGGLTFA
jgi:hypothetical protein